MLWYHNENLKIMALQVYVYLSTVEPSLRSLKYYEHNIIWAQFFEDAMWNYGSSFGRIRRWSEPDTCVFKTPVLLDLDSNNQLSRFSNYKEVGLYHYFKTELGMIQGIHVYNKQVRK